MIDIICLWVGRIVVAMLLIIFSLIFLYYFIKIICIPLQRPWYCIKRLMPWKWISKDEYKRYVRNCYKVKKNPNKYEAWKRGTKVIRIGRFGNFIIPNKQYWWEPKNHFFIIKKT